MKRNPILKILFVGFIFMFIASLASNDPSAVSSPKIPLSDFIKQLEEDKLSEVIISNDRVVAKTKDGQGVIANYPYPYSMHMVDKLLKKDVVVNFAGNDSNGSVWIKILFFVGNLLSWLPMILLGMFLYRMTKQGKDTDNKKANSFLGGGIFQFGKSKAKKVESSDINVKLADVAGIDEAKEDVAEIIDFLRYPDMYRNIGAVIPKGCLLVGAPGTGKTMLAKAIAAEAKVPFFFISGSDFVEMFVGVGASRVRSLFAQAKKSTPCIIFIDEIDAVGRHRGGGVGGGNDEREQTLNQLLVEMDGFNDNSGVIIIAATNRIDVLDKALLRPGRFDRQVNVPLPDVKGREQILAVHTSKLSFTPDVDFSVIARGTPGFSGAELANLCNEAALFATKHRKKFVTKNDFEEAKDKLLMGSSRKTIMKERERKLTAYHEGGHALVALSLEASDPIHKATIVPRGFALGAVIRLPKDDKFSVTVEEMKADIAVGMAGRAAEELIFGDDKVTSGASSDIQMVTKMAKSMVRKWGLSKKVGTLDYSEMKEISDKVANDIDDEVKSLVQEGHNLARSILKEKESLLHKIADYLLKKETLTGEELNIIYQGKELVEAEKRENIAKSKLADISNS